MKDEIDAVIRFYNAQLKKQHKRMIKLDLRGADEEMREETIRSIRKYEIVLMALQAMKEKYVSSDESQDFIYASMTLDDIPS